MAGIAAQACGAGLVSAAAVGDDGYESNLRGGQECGRSRSPASRSSKTGAREGLNEECSATLKRTSMRPRSDGRILLVYLLVALQDASSPVLFVE